jgi:CheY-like chemotaxis protein/CRP-like cAMP-binding protein
MSVLMKKILVIEDMADVRENLQELLEISGYQVATASDGAEGVDKALEERPDLILCDVMMPRLDGFTVLNILSKRPETADIPFVFLTAKTEKEDFRKGMDLGADDYLTKPFSVEELLNVVETRLKKAERLKHFGKTDEGLSAFINEAKGYEELKKLSIDKRKKLFKKRDMLFEEGDSPRYLFFINKGQVKTYKTNDIGKEYIINIRSEGDFIGYTALIKDEPYSFSAAALENVEASLIPKEEFLKLLHANRDVSSRLIKMLADNVAEKEAQLLSLAYNSVRKRVAEAILLLHDRHSREGREDIQILREDLAHIVGTAKESVIRMLTEFKEDGFIDITDGVIRLLNRKKLEGLPT